MQDTSTNYRYYTAEPLTNDQLRTVAPSIFAERPWAEMSDRYTFIPTIRIVEEMRKEGLVPYFAKQTISPVEGRTPFAMHMIRFRDTSQRGQKLVVGDLYPEVTLINSHDGGASYRLMAALLRAACMNGLMVSDSEFAAIHVMHRGNVTPVLEASFQVIEQFPKIMGEVGEFQRIDLRRDQQLALAESALELKYDERDDGSLACPITADAVLMPRRSDDSKPTLWNTYNVVQENLMKGGQRGLTIGANHRTRRVKTRPVKAIATDVKLNKALWTLTARMAELVGAPAAA